ncbi:MAG: DDE-type integrase/transposase/recombinase [Catenibacterium sp.]
MFEILGVKRANYYKWLKHNKSERDLENEELADFIRKYDEKFNHTLGYRMMTDRINRDENKNYNDKRGLQGDENTWHQVNHKTKRRSCTVRKSNNTAKNNLKRDFNASRPNEKWVTDVTEFKYGKNNENKLYLSLILDLYDRYPVGYAISDHNDNRLVFNTFRSAVDANPGAHPLFHSDGGYQYTSPVFVRMLKDNGMEQSMSRVHSPH